MTFVPVVAPCLLVTFEPSADVWALAALAAEASDLKMFDVAGSIVRLRPPPAAPPEVVERVRAAALACGAAAVQVVPAPKAEPLPDEAREAPAKSVTAREAVASLVEAANVEDRPALAALCEELMARHEV